MSKKKAIGKPIPGFPGYLATKCGNIIGKRGNKIKPGITRQNRERVILYKDGDRIQTLVHRLIAITYIPNPNNLPNVLHIDNNPRNNHYKNLKWGTQSENIQQCSDDGRHIGNTKYSPTIKLRAVELHGAGKNMRAIARELGTSYMTIRRICKNI